MNAAPRTAVILAAGRGRRMWPYDEVRPKAALPILNQPLVARLVDDLCDVGIQRVVVVVGYHGQRIRHALAGREAVRFVQQAQPLGSADALLCAMPLIDDESFLVVCGDLLLDRADLRSLIAAYEASEAPLAAMVRAIGDEDARDWLGAWVEDGAIARIAGHAVGAPYRLCGVYAMHRRALNYVAENPGIMESVPVGGMPPVETELAASVQMMLDDGLALPAVEAGGAFVDLDKPWHILEANRAAIAAATEGLDGVRAAPSARISDAAEVRGPVVLAEGAVIGPRAVIEGPLWLGAGSRIENGPILGPGVVVGPHCTLANYCQIGGGSAIGPHGAIDHCAEFGGVTMDRVYLSHYMEFWGVIGSATDLGAATVCGNLRFDDGRATHRVLGRSESPRQGANAVYLGDYCRTGVNVILMPGVKVGSYSCLGPGLVVYEDVPARSLLLVRQEVVRKEWGPDRYGW